MGQDCFQSALLPLKESSKAAVADAACETLGEAKDYLHIQRDVEVELQKILSAVADSTSGQLVLVCGNVGDGKSHLISVLLQEYPAYRDLFSIYNDATESSSPTATNIDELNRILEPYRDENLPTCSKKSILAINLGTLNNFLVADAGKSFSQLGTFVEKKQILEVGLPLDNAFDSKSPFQYVNFSDHNIFYLTRNGPTSPIIEEALGKVVSHAAYDNPFYKAYSDQCSNCSANCPIKLNFEILQNPDVRTKISELLVQCIVKHHHIISIRALYNFIFDLIVPAELDGMGRDDIINWVGETRSDAYLQRLFINHLFEHPEVSKIHAHLHYLDPALRRSSFLDDQIVSLITQENPEDQLQKINGPESLQNVLTRHSKESNDDDTLVKSYVRLLFFSNSDTVENQFGDSTYNDYMRLLYSWHTGDRAELKKLYKLIQRATMAWLGKAPSGEMLLEIGNQQLKYKLSESVSITPGLLPEEGLLGDDVRKFSNILPLKFKSATNDALEFSLHVDFRLYEMACRVDSGCRANQSDKSNFIAFTSFSHDVMKAGGQDKRLRITEAETGQSFLLEIDEFGDFTFKRSKE